ncbi:MAG: lactate utilization protein C [bacterium]
MKTEKKTQLFKEQYEKLAGQVYVTQTPSGVVKAMQEILAQSKARKGVTTPEFVNLPLQPQKLLTPQNFPRVPFEICDELSPPGINAADVGVSAVSFGIAFTGTVVEVTANDSARLVSSLPRVHVALLPGTEIVPSLEEAAPRLRRIYAEHPGSCQITFISGPSRTADIEMRLFLGVHGPQASYVIVCDF